jgi:hypothetical protein
MTSTASAIRDRCHVLIEALTPTSDTRTRFRSFRNEGAADFDEWAEANPTACLRRFQIRDDGSEDPPEVSNTDTDLRHITLIVKVAYPHTGRHGTDGALDRDDVMDQDWGLINGKLGIYGRSNFSGSHDCTPLGAERSVERGATVDVLVVTVRLSFYRLVT